MEKTSRKSINKKNTKVTGCYEDRKHSFIHATNQMISEKWFEAYSGSSIG